MTTFLSTEEIEALTGYKQHSKQVQHLKRQRIPFHTNKSGHPIVTREAIAGGKSTPTPKSWEPKWHAAQA
jgi:hypothetical protein